jgi:hypothetical protein
VRSLHRDWGKDDIMSDKNSDKTPRPASSEYIDHRRRQKERLLNSPYVEAENVNPFKVHGKDHHVQFRISPFAEKVGSEVAALFNMSLSQYTKAVLYLNLGLVFEPVDRRRKKRYNTEKPRMDSRASSQLSTSSRSKRWF